MGRVTQLSLLGTVLLAAYCGGEALASGGVVKFKTDNGPDGYYYNANGIARARYCAFYNAGEFDGQAIICGIRILALDQSVITPGTDDYVLGGDLRAEDANNAGYADIGTGGLLSITDLSSRGSCSTTGAARTQTFGGGAGVPDPLTTFLLTCPQPRNHDPNEGIDFCGVLLDTSSVFSNSARTQAYSVPENPLFTSIGFNHFVEAIVFEPKFQDLNIRMTGSSRFPGDRGLPVMFARRICNPAESNCLAESGDGPVSTSDDFITARITLDNNTCSPISANVTINADRSPINPKLGPTDVTLFFRPCGGGAPIMNPLTLPAKSRTNLCLEIKTAIKRRFLGAFPVNLPFVVDAIEPNTLLNLDSETQLLGLRQSAGYYDDDSHSAFFFTQTPVATGDDLTVRYDAADMQNRDNTATTYSLAGAQIVAGEFGASGLPGLDAVVVRNEDPIVPGAPDLSPGGLVRQVGVIGDPGNADGIAFGPPATTVNIDFTDVNITPSDFALAQNNFICAALNPGDTGASVTAIGATGGGDVFVGNSSTLLGGVLPIFPFTQNDLEIRPDHGSELGNAANFKRRKTRPVNAPLLTPGRYIALDKNGNRIN